MFAQADKKNTTSVASSPLPAPVWTPELPEAAARFCAQVGVRVPLICGAMYPCSNVELVAAVSDAGGLAVVQPIALAYAHGRDMRAGLWRIRELTSRPVGFNVIVEKSSRIYTQRMQRWVDIALEEGIRFFVTALGNPRWVVDKAHAHGGVVYHDVTNRHWAEVACSHGVDGLICVNRLAGGHVGAASADELLADLSTLGVPLVCAGGIGEESEFAATIRKGYAAVQMGTRFVATEECSAHADYKQAIIVARASDIVATYRISGVPVAVINTPYVKRVGTDAGALARRLLQHPRAKHYMRLAYTLRAIPELKRASLRGSAYKDYFQAGQSVEAIDKIEPVAQIVSRCAQALALQATGSAAQVDSERDSSRSGLATGG